MNENEKRLLDSATTEHAWPLVELFSTIRREHPDDCNRAAQHLIDRLKALGVPVKVHEPQLYLALPQGAHVDCEGRKLFARPAPLSKPAPDGVNAPLAFVEKPVNPPPGWDPASAGVFGDNYDPAPGTPDLTGKIVVQHGMISSERVMAVETLGAAGIIFVNPGKYAHWGGGSYTWGTADVDDLPHKPGIPAVAVNNADGQALIALAGRGGSATIVTQFETGWFRSLLPVVEIPGKSEPEKFVLLHGHYDSWDVGVGDNATGDACMLEIARMLWTHRDQLERSVRIAWWPGHSTGRFAGSTWYVDEYALDLARNCLAHLNCDSPGCRDATEYSLIPWMAENAGFVKGVVKDAASKDAEGRRPHQSSDFSFNNLGITGFFSSSSRIPQSEIKARGYYYVMGNGGNLEWHTDDDLMPVADRSVLLTDIKVYALAVFRLANAAVLPWDWRALLKEFDATLAKYQSAAGNRFDLSPAQNAVARLDAALMQMAAGLEAGKVKAKAANGALHDISRLLVPLNYTTGTRFRRDLSKPASPLTALSVATALDRYPVSALPFATTQLRRGLNQLLTSLDEARERVQAVIPA
ncbi:MAG: M28 family peptidase [Xanthobacteraceae bacterium]|nr:M28 family peptidase [Xanthobacteraceae bacterium]